MHTPFQSLIRQTIHFATSSLNRQMDLLESDPEFVQISHRLKNLLDFVKNSGDFKNDLGRSRFLNKEIYKKQFANFLYYPYVSHAVSLRIEHEERFFTKYAPVYIIRKWKIRSAA